MQRVVTFSTCLPAKSRKNKGPEIYFLYLDLPLGRGLVIGYLGTDFSKSHIRS